ncbi:MAG: TorF family putative porin [Pseudomonas sp.]
MNLRIVSALSLSLLWAGHSHAEISANLTATSNYVFNGVSYSNGNPAIQGGLDWNTDAGWYLGTWATSIDYAPFGFRDDKAEVDYYGGFAGQLTEQFGYDLGINFFTYPGIDDGANESDYYELYGSLSFEENTSLKLSYSPDYSGEVGKSLILLANHSIALPQDFSLLLEASYTQLLDNDNFQDSYWFGDDHYTHWGVGLARTFYGFDTSLKYSDTDASSSHDPDDIAGPQLSFSVGRVF